MEPILGTILTLGATSAVISSGIVLLAVYSFGLGLPFLLTALFTNALVGLKAFSCISRILQFLAGAVMTVMGLAMITGQLSVFAYGLLDMFPALTRISAEAEREGNRWAFTITG